MRLSGSKLSHLENMQATEAEEGADWRTPRDAATRRELNVADQETADNASTDDTGEALPEWQKAFMLGPTVRFTRTPDKGKQKRALAPEMPTAEEILAILQPGSVASNASPVPQAGFSASAPGARALVDDLSAALKNRAAVLSARRSTDLQADSAASFASRVTAKAAEAAEIEMKAETIIDDAPSTHVGRGMFSQPSSGPHAPAVAARIAATNLPDHLIWEMMSLGASEDAEQARKSLTPSGPADMPALAPTRQQTPSLHAAKAANRPLTPVRQSIARPFAEPDQPPAPRAAKTSVTMAVDGVDTERLSPLHFYRQVALRAAGVTDAQPKLQPEPIIAVPAENDIVPAIAVPMPAATQSVTAAEIRTPVQPAPQQLATVGHKPITPIRPFRVEMPTVDGYEFPSVDLLQTPEISCASPVTQEGLQQSAGLLENVLEDFGIKGEIIDVRPGPVVTLYEFEPAPGVKSSRVIGLSEDIARSMSALSARVAVIPGRNVIGIELPNPVRETVYLRELVESETYANTAFRLPLCLGKTIGGEPVVAELAKMPHLLVAGTTGSGKSVAINTMILSLLYRYTPEQCRLIMIDPKMLELSVYDGIPHLLSPVVTDPKKAVLALKWAVREMEDRYRKMSRLNVRNIDGFNARVAQASAAGETISINVPVGFDRQTGEQTFEQQDMDLTALPYIVVIVDEMADLMMVAGKEIEGAIQRLAQMARAAGIHIVMATQRPSVDVITGTIKANFPTRISFQVTSKIDSRTILGEQGAENLLGQGDMLHMMGGGRIARVHGPFVSDREVERVVAHLKTQGQPAYLGSVTEDEEEVEEVVEEQPVFDKSSMGEEDRDELYEQAIKVVMRDRKCSTSYIQRRLSIGYNRAASLVERMEKDGLVGPANHVGKREILSQKPAEKMPEPLDDEDGE